MVWSKPLVDALWGAPAPPQPQSAQLPPRLPLDVLRLVVAHLDDDTFIRSDTVSTAWRELCQEHAALKGRQKHLCAEAASARESHRTLVDLKQQRAAAEAYAHGLARSHELLTWGSHHPSHFLESRACLINAEPFVFRQTHWRRPAEMRAEGSPTAMACSINDRQVHPLISPNGAWVAYRDFDRHAAAPDQTVEICKVERERERLLLNRPLTFFRHGAHHTSLSAPDHHGQFSLDSAVWAVHRRQNIEIYQTGETFKLRAICHTARCSWDDAFTLSPDGRFVLCCEPEPNGVPRLRQLVVFDALTGQRKAQRLGHLPWPHAAAFSGGGAYLALAHHLRVDLFDWQTDFVHPIAHYPMPADCNRHLIPSLAFAPSCDVLAVLTQPLPRDERHSLTLLEVRTGATTVLHPSQTYIGRHMARLLQWSPNGHRVMASTSHYEPQTPDRPIATVYNFGAVTTSIQAWDKDLTPASFFGRTFHKMRQRLAWVYRQLLD